MALKLAQLHTGGGVPNTCAAVGAGRDDATPVWAVRRRRHRAGVAAQLLQLLAAGGIPDARRLVGTRGDVALAVRAVRSSVDGVAVALARKRHAVRRRKRHGITHGMVGVGRVIVVGVLRDLYRADGQQQRQRGVIGRIGDGALGIGGQGACLRAAGGALGLGGAGLGGGALVARFDGRRIGGGTLCLGDRLLRGGTVGVGLGDRLLRGGGSGIGLRRGALAVGDVGLGGSHIGVRLGRGPLAARFGGAVLGVKEEHHGDADRSQRGHQGNGQPPAAFAQPVGGLLQLPGRRLLLLGDGVDGPAAVRHQRRQFVADAQFGGVRPLDPRLRLCQLHGVEQAAAPVAPAQPLAFLGFVLQPAAGQFGGAAPVDPGVQAGPAADHRLVREVHLARLVAQGDQAVGRERGQHLVEHALASPLPLRSSSTVCCRRVSGRPSPNWISRSRMRCAAVRSASFASTSL